MISEEFKNFKKSIKNEVKDQKLKDLVEDRLEQTEIPRPKKIKSDLFLEFPDDVTNIIDSELGNYLAIYEVSAGWADYIISRREIDLEHAECLLDYVHDKLYIRAKGSSTEKKAYIKSDNFYLQCVMEVNEIRADLKLLRSRKNTLEKYGKAISREITNRKDERDNFPKRRSSNIIDKNQSEVFKQY